MKRVHTGLILITLRVFSSTLYAQSREVWLSGGVSNFRFLYRHTNRDLGSPDTAGEPSDVFPPPVPFRGGAIFDLEYRIMVPRNTRLVINHDAGEVQRQPDESDDCAQQPAVRQDHDRG